MSSAILKARHSGLLEEFNGLDASQIKKKLLNLSFIIAPIPFTDHVKYYGQFMDIHDAIDQGGVFPGMSTEESVDIIIETFDRHIELANASRDSVEKERNRAVWQRVKGFGLFSTSIVVLSLMGIFKEEIITGVFSLVE